MNRQTSFVLALGLTLLVFVTVVGACATPQPVAVEEVEEPAKPDPFDLFSGVRLKGDGPFRVQAEPTAIEKARLLVEVLKVRVTELENPDGGSEKEISLRIRFNRGERSKVLWMEVGESTAILGTRVRLVEGGDSYVEKRQEYFPYALLEVN